MKISMDKHRQEQAQQLADTTREIIMSVSSEEEKQLKESLENIVDQLNELGLPYTLLTIVPYELDRNQIGSLQYNNFSGLILNAKTEEEKKETESLIRYCDYILCSDSLRYFTNNYVQDYSFSDIFALFTQKAFAYFRYHGTGGLERDKGSILKYFKQLVSKNQKYE